MKAVKIIGRTLIILLAAMIVIAGVNALATAGVIQTTAGRGEFRPDFAAQTGDGSTALMRPRMGERGEGGDHDAASLVGLVEVGKNLLKMSLIGAVIVLLARTLKVVSKRRTPALPAG